MYSQLYQSTVTAAVLSLAIYHASTKFYISRCTYTACEVCCGIVSVTAMSRQLWDSLQLLQQHLFRP